MPADVSAPASAGTVPAKKTQDGGEAPPLAIRWIFPALGTSITPLTSARTLLGRGEECDARLPGSETSRQHAEIRRDGSLFILRDLVSTNGTFRNGAPITEAPLSSGDLIRLGEWIGLCAAVPEGELSAPGSAYGTFAPGLFAGPALQPTLAQARRAAASDLPIIIEGETGTGKEGLSRAIHTWSGRRGPFLAVNCSALPEALAEAELFGYQKGAFTGADRTRPGHFRAAEGGTLLLDEVTDLPVAVQAKLLRVLEQREVLPLGQSLPQPVDVRVIAAGQGSLLEAANARRFRADLFARLDGVTLRLPPLRARVEEIPFLFVRLMQQHAGGEGPSVEPKLIEQLCLYDWPFNVREMDLLVRGLLVMYDGQGSLRKADLPERFRAPGPATVTPSPLDDGDAPAEARRRGTEAERRVRAEKDVAALAAALRAHRGNVVRAAAEVGISRQRAYRLMELGADLDLEQLRGEGRSDEPRTPEE